MGTIKLKLELVELEKGNYHILIEAEFDGLENGWWVIDTGASKSVIDRNLTELFQVDDSFGVSAKGIGTDVVETGTGRIEAMRLGGKTFGPFEVATVDLRHINSEYTKFSDKKIIGLLGSDFLFQNRAVIDYGEKWLII